MSTDRTLIEPALLTLEQAADLFGVGVTKLHELRGEPWFPTAIALAPRVVRFSRAELLSAIERMPRQREPVEPLQLVRGKAARRAEAAP